MTLKVTVTVQCVCQYFQKTQDKLLWMDRNFSSDHDLDVEGHSYIKACKHANISEKGLVAICHIILHY